MQTPLEKLIGLPGAGQHLKHGLTLQALERQAQAMTDHDAARALQRARTALFQDINRRSSRAA